VFLLLLCTFCLNSQESDRQSKWSLELQYSPNYSFRMFLFNERWHDSIIEFRNEDERAILGYNTGVMLKYRLNPTIAIEAGFQLALEGSQLQDVPFTDSAGVITGSVRSKYKYTYLELPLRMFYKTNNSSFDLHLFFGGSLKYAFSNRIESYIEFEDGSTFEDEGEDEYSSLNDFNFELLFGFDVPVRLHERLFLSFEPIGRFALIRTYDAPLRQFQYSAGLQVGLEVVL